MGETAADDAIAELSAQGHACVAAPPALVWAIAGDSNRWDRVIRAGPSAYTSEAIEGQSQRLLVGHGKFGGIPLSWLERGEWMEGEYLVGERRYLSGPLSLAGFRVDISAGDDGTDVSLRSYLRPAQQLPEAFAAAIQQNLEKAVTSYLAALVELFDSGQVPEQEPNEPAASYGRRALLALRPNKLLDRIRPVNETDFAACEKRLAELPIDQDMRQRIVDYVRTRADLELEQIRPFALAKMWKVRRRPLLRSFLHAANAGLFDLRWQLNCPHCRVGADVVDTLASIKPNGHCDMCDVDFEIDFAENVEAVFRPNPAIREIKDRVYCTSSPWFRPHVYGVIELKPGEVRRAVVPLARDGFVARSLLGQRSIDVDGKAARLVVTDSELAVTMADDGDDRDVIELVNQAERPCTLLLERRKANIGAAHGTDILTLPEFLDLYGTEAPASGADLTIGRVVVLFSDLTNTTVAYRSLGDARAFSLIHEHFREMGSIVAEHSGAILKTMGDAVMASFVRPQDALRAGLAMIEATRSRHSQHGFRLKVGVHDGPCVMVRANQRMDLFGTTVNIASRLQERARADQLVMMMTALDNDAVAGVLAERSLVHETAQVELKGLGSDHTVAVVTVPEQ